MKRVEHDCLFFYSDISVCKTKLFDLHIKGNPGYLGSPAGRKEWIEEVMSRVNKNIDDPYGTLYEILKETTGLFLILIVTVKKIVIASDHIRSFPVFYGFNKGIFFITDNIEYYQRDYGRLDIDQDRIEEFLAVGNVFGRGTIYKNVHGIQAAEIVSREGEYIQTDRFFVFKPALQYDVYNKIEDFAKDFNDLFLFVFSRMVNQNPDVNNWFVPLSGGHDSRLVVNFLYRLGVKNVKCFTYGSHGNEQAQISKQVADALGYDWYFVEYTNQKWKELFDNGLFNEYVDYAFNGVSTVHIQDFLALYELRAEGIIREGDVILPGHTVVTESVFSEELRKLKNLEETLQYVYSRIEAMSPGSQPPSKVLTALGHIYKELRSAPEHFMAICDWQERQAKFITNSVRAYEFFGFRCFLPMWDMEMVKFWLKIPPRNGDEREPLYHAERLGGLVEELADVPYANSEKNSARVYIIRVIKRVVPYFLIVRLLRLIKRQVVLNEGLNQVFALSAGSVKELLEPIDDFPKESIPYFREYLGRYPYQLDYNKLTTLYTIRLLLDKLKNE